MCIGLWSLNHPDYALILCTNRDEYLRRPTEPAHWHSFGDSSRGQTSSLNISGAGTELATEHNERSPTVLSGIDTLAGGTWFGINKAGEIALLTNITEPTVNLLSSRGHLCASFLLRPHSQSLVENNESLIGYVSDLTNSDTQYAGFNLLLLAPRATNENAMLAYDVALVSNKGAGNSIASDPVLLSGSPQACGGISNGVSSCIDPFTGLKSPSGEEWPKVKRGKNLLGALLAESEGADQDVIIEKLFELLKSKAHFPPKTRQEFQETIAIDPVDLSRLRRGPSFSRASNRDQAQVQDDSENATVREAPSFRSGPNESEVSRETPTTANEHPPPNYFATRLSSVLLVRRDGHALFIERDVWVMDQDGKPAFATVEKGTGNDHHERRFSFWVE